MASLREIVEEAYRVFADAPVGPMPQVCLCPVCFDGDTALARRLVTTPLRDIPADLLAAYTNSAHGWCDEMRYFLPRYLDLLARGEVPGWNGPEYVLSRLSLVPWRETWPAAEREALERFFDTLLEHALGCRPGEQNWRHPDGSREFIFHGTPVPPIVGLVSMAGGDLGRLLRIADATRGRSADLHFAAVVGDVIRPLFRERFHWGTTTPGDDSERRLLAWLLRPEMEQRLEAAFFASDDPVEAAALSDAVALLDRGRAAEGGW